MIVSSDTASCSEKLQRSNRSESMVGSRISGTMSIAMRRSIAESAAARDANPTRNVMGRAS